MSDPTPKDEASEWEALRRKREWPTPNHMRRCAEALDLLIMAKSGAVLRFVADACDGLVTAPPEADLASTRQALQEARRLLARWEKFYGYPSRRRPLGPVPSGVREDTHDYLATHPSPEATDV